VTSLDGLDPAETHGGAGVEYKKVVEGQGLESGPRATASRSRRMRRGFGRWRALDRGVTISVSSPSSSRAPRCRAVARFLDLFRSP
jgi:hypothetical protein